MRPFIRCTIRILVCVIMVFMVLATGTASDQIPAPPQKRPIAITNTTIHTVTGHIVENGTIVFDGGRITAIGTDVAIPEGAEIISAPGRHVYPGLISPDTYIGLTEIGAVRSTVDRSETGEINPNVRAERAVNPESELIPVTRANGITLMVTSPSGGLISGMSAVMMMDGWTYEDMTFKAPAALYVEWPSMKIAPSPPAKKSEDEQKKEREATIQKVTDAFLDARAYMIAKDAETAKGIPYHDVDARWEAMIPVLQRTIPVVVRADEIRQIEAAVAWATALNIRLIIAGGYDSWMVADLLKAANVPVVVGGIHSLPLHRFDAYDYPFALPAKLYNEGVAFAIASAEEAPHERNLPYHAATAAAYGLPRDEALKAITLYPAQIFGIADRVGSLETGKDATLIVTTGDPLDIRSQVEMQFIQGRKIDLTSRHTMLYDKYREKYRRMKP